LINASYIANIALQQVGDGWFFRTGGCSGDSEELKTLKTLTAVSGHGRAKENK